MPPLVETFLFVMSAAIAVAGWGSGLSAILRIESNFGDRGILGLLCVGIFGCLINFLFPLTPLDQLFILGGGVVLAVIYRTDIIGSKQQLFIVLVVFFFALSHRQSSTNYDTGLYHLQSLRWITEYQIVPGLGGLHGRLAFNSMIFPIAGIVDRAGVGWISNFLVIFFALTSMLMRFWVAASRSTRSRIEFWFLLFAILVISENSFFVRDLHWVLNSDSIIVVLILYWTAAALRLATSAHPATDISLIVLSGVLATTVKLSVAPLLLPAVVLAWIHRKDIEATSVWRVSTVAGIAFMVWMLRSFTLSGCAVYPVASTCIFELPWAQLESYVRGEAMSIRSWARKPWDYDFARVLKDMAWLPSWIGAVRQDPAIILLLVFAPLGSVAGLLRRKVDERPWRGLHIIASGLIVCLIFWFWSAPDPRFGRGFIVAFALLGASVVFSLLPDRPQFSRYVPALVLAGLFLVSFRGLRLQASDYFYTIPKVTAYEVKGLGGRQLFVPKGSDQCWDHKLPCTPYVGYAPLEKIQWPANWPAAPPGWTPDDPLQIGKKAGLPD